MGGNPDHCLDIRLKYGRVQQSLSRAYIDNDFAYISAIPPDSLTLEFDIRYSLDISQQSWLTVEVAIECQGSTVGSWSNNTLAYHPPSWEHHSFATAPVNGSVLLSITIEKQSSSLSRINGHIYFDNFRYIIGSDSKSSEVGLTLNGTTVSDGDGNTGSVGIYANPGQKDETPLSSCWTTSQNFQFDSSYDISFHYQYSMYVKGLNASAALTIFSAPVNLDPTWQINYTIPSGRPPAGHTGYSYGVYLHSQWLATGVKDGAGYNYPYTYNGTTRFVKLAEISNPVGKTFSIYASSSNHILQVYLQKSSTTSGPWINVSAGTYFVKNDWLRVMATLRSISATGNYANVSIFYPDQTVWQSADSPAEVSFHDNNDTLTSRSWQIPQISQSCAGSNWTATVSFDNSTQCGMRQQTFSVVIHTNATKSSPSAGARILWGQPVPVNVTWQSSDDASFIADASARVRYVDRYLQVQYVTMSPNGQGAYSTDFATNLMTPNLVAQFYVELFRYGFVNASYAGGTQLIFTINLVNDITSVMIRPTQQSGPDIYTGETSRSQGYTSEVKFYDPYQAAYVLNGTSVWPNVYVNYSLYEDTGLGWQGPIVTGIFAHNATSRSFYKHDATYGVAIQRVKYDVTMRILEASWDFEQQNFSIIIVIVSHGTDLDALATVIRYPPAGTGTGWVQYDSVSDIYEPHVYWGESLNVTVYYMNQSTSLGLAGATVRILIGASLYPVTDRGNGYYNYSVSSSSFSLGTYDLQVNATLLDHAAQTIRIRLVVVTRATELTKDPTSTIVERPWNDTFITVFTFRDVVNPASPIPIAGATVTVTGYISGSYSVQDNLDGTYRITFFGNVSENTYGVTIGFSYVNRATKSQYYEIIIRRIATECAATPAEVSVPWGDNVTISFTYRDRDHGLLNITGATISFTWQTGIQGTDYWIQNNPDGTYTIVLNTTKVGVGTWPFAITFTGAKNHYDGAQAVVSFQVRNVMTVLYRTSIEPGTSVPWGDNLTIVLTYNDADHGYMPISGATFSCDWDSFYWTYAYNATRGAYVVTIRTESRSEGSYTLHIQASKSHYQSFMTVESFVLRQIQTICSTDPSPYFPAHYWGENLSIRIEYWDVDHNETTPYADIVTDWSGDYTIYDFENGTYDFVFNTTSHAIGLHSITISFSRIHFANQTVVVSLTLIPVGLLVDVVSATPVTAEYGDPVVITVRVTENLHSRLINDSVTTYHWGGGSGAMAPVGAGIYNVTFLAMENTSTYVVTIEANSTGYQLGIGYVLLYILPTDTDLSLLTSSIEVVVGESFIISVNFTTWKGVEIEENATVTYFWVTNRTGSFVSIGGGIWNATLSSSGLEAGQYSVYITAGGPNFVEQRQILHVFLTVIPTELAATPVVQDVYYGENFTVLVYFNDTHHSLPISGANILFYWGDMNGSLIPTGTPGFYTITLPSTIFPAGTSYTLTLQVDYEGYRACLESVLVYVRAQPTHLVLVRAESEYSSDHGPILIGLTGTYWRVPRGDTLYLHFNFTDNSNRTLLGATGLYAWEYGSGVLEYIDGLYVARMNLTGISPGLYYPTILLSRQNYETGHGPLTQLEVILTPTDIVVEQGPSSYFTGQVFSLTVSLNDTYHNVTIRGARLTASIPGIGRLDIPLVDNEDGSYTLRDLSFSTEGTYVIAVDAEGGLTYAADHHEFTVVVTLHPVTRNLASIGALAALVGVIALGGWLAYARVFSIPWLVRKMRGMARTIGKGETPGLSQRERTRIPSRPDQLSNMAEPLYTRAGVAMPKAVLYPMAQLDEKASEDEAIWQQLKELPHLELEQKTQLFTEMKRIPAAERVWFVQDLKRQMADGTRFARKAKKPEAPKTAPEVEQEIRARLATFPALGKEEKERLFRQLSSLPKAEWDAVFAALAESGKSAKPAESKVLPDELPSITEEERAELMRDLAHLGPEEREKVLKTLKAKHGEVNEGPESKSVKEKREVADAESRKAEEKSD
jgi:hypothetical protein